jgi:hypothetical protein
MTVRLAVRSPIETILDPEQFEALPAPVRRLHSLRGPVRVSGLADITASSNPLAWLIRRIAGLPKAGRGVPVTVEFLPDGPGREQWKRRFASRRYSSVMAAGKGCYEGLLIERFGPFRLVFTLKPTAKGLAWKIERWRLLGLPLPRWTAPAINCLECADGARFVFEIDVAFPIAGHVTRYRGWLEAEDKAFSEETS